MQNKSYLYKIIHNRYLTTRNTSHSSQPLEEMTGLRNINFFENDYIFSEPTVCSINQVRKKFKTKRNQTNQKQKKTPRKFVNKKFERKIETSRKQKSLSLPNKQKNIVNVGQCDIITTQIIHSRHKSRSNSNTVKFMPMVDLKQGSFQQQNNTIDCQNCIKKISFQLKEGKKSNLSHRKSQTNTLKILNMHPPQRISFRERKNSVNLISTAKKMFITKNKPYRPWSPDKNQNIITEIGQDMQAFIQISLP